LGLAGGKRLGRAGRERTAARGRLAILVVVLVGRGFVAVDDRDPRLARRCGLVVLVLVLVVGFFVLVLVLVLVVFLLLLAAVLVLIVITHDAPARGCSRPRVERFKAHG